MLYRTGERIDDAEQIPYGEVTGDWSDGWTYVIGAGPSLLGFNFEVLDGHTIGANKSAFEAKTDTLATMDWKFAEGYAQEIADFKGDKYIGIMNIGKVVYSEGATYLKTVREGSLSTDPTLIVGLNSGYAALNVAFLKGAKKIGLLGFDMQIDSVKHFHGGYEWDKSKGASYNSWARRFKFAKTKLEEHGVQVVNYVGPKGSGLQHYFPSVSLKELDKEYPQ